MVRHKGPARGPTMVDRVCERCGKPFQATAHVVSTGKGRFCSKTCSNRTRGAGDVSLTCGYCGRTFTRLRSDFTREQPDDVYCSKDCYGMARTGGLSRTCRVCGEIKPLGDFGVFRRDNQEYHRHTCLDCWNWQQRQNRASNPERRREYDRRSYKKHRDAVINRKVRLNARRRAWMYGITDVADVGLADLIERDGSTCYLCGKNLDREEMQIDHVIPLSRGGSHTLKNTRIACRFCNNRKGNYLLSELDFDTLKPMIKDCAHCGEVKPISEFSTMGTKKWHKHCRKCQASLARQDRSTRRNITVVNTLNEVYRCNVCDAEWTPQQEDGLENIRWYWRCPNGCNHDGNRWEPGERTCSHCGSVKPIEDFPGKTSRRSECRDCWAALGRQSRAAVRNLTVVDSVRDKYRCNACNGTWIPQLKPGHKHMKGWWRCPNGCNK